MKRIVKLTESDLTRIVKRVLNEEDEKLYVIKKGDTLSKISRSLGVSLNELLNANPKFKANPNIIKVGEYLTIPNNLISKVSSPESLVNSKDEIQKGWDEVKDLKMELLGTLKDRIQKFESDPNIDLCGVMTMIHFDLTNFYNNPYVKQKGWDSRNCKNFSQLDKLMKED